MLLKGTVDGCSGLVKISLPEDEFKKLDADNSNTLEMNEFKVLQPVADPEGCILLPLCFACGLCQGYGLRRDC